MREYNKIIIGLRRFIPYLQGTVTPRVGASVNAGASLCLALICGVLELEAGILNLQFPTTAEIGFSKFPLDVGQVHYNNTIHYNSHAHNITQYLQAVHEYPVVETI